MPPRIEPITQIEQLWILALATTAIVGSFVLQPSLDGNVHLPISINGFGTQLPEGCIFRMTTGFPCPGCGLTRSFVHMAHGQFLKAAEFNLMGPVLYVICILQIPYRIVEYMEVYRSNVTWQKLKLSLGPLAWFIIGGLLFAWLFKLV